MQVTTKAGDAAEVAELFRSNRVTTESGLWGAWRPAGEAVPEAIELHGFRRAARAGRFVPAGAVALLAGPLDHRGIAKLMNAVAPRPGSAPHAVVVQLPPTGPLTADATRALIDAHAIAAEGGTALLLVAGDETSRLELAALEVPGGARIAPSVGAAMQEAAAFVAASGTVVAAS